MKKIIRFILALMATLSVVTVAFGVIPQTETPLCTDNQTAFVSLDNTSGNYGFYACYTKPQAFKLKIVRASLIKADGSGSVEIYAPTSPTYVDLIAGEFDLLKDLDLSSGLYDGTYSGIEIIYDNDLQIKARAEYSGSDLPSWGSRTGSKGYCHTLGYNATTDPAYMDSFAGTANGNPRRLGDSPVFEDSEGTSYMNPGLVTFRYLGSPMVGAGIQGVNRVYIGSGTTEGAYWAKVRYSATGDASTTDFSILDTAMAETRNSSSARYARYIFNFSNNLSINSASNQTIEIAFDLTKAIGFAWNYTSGGDGTYAYSNGSYSDGGSYYYTKGRNAGDTEQAANGYPDCLRMLVGMVGFSLTLRE